MFTGALLVVAEIKKQNWKPPRRPSTTGRDHLARPQPQNEREHLYGMRWHGLQDARNADGKLEEGDAYGNENTTLNNVTARVAAARVITCSQSPLIHYCGAILAAKP